MIAVDPVQGRRSTDWLRVVPALAVGVTAAAVLAIVSAHVPVHSDRRPLDGLAFTLLVAAGMAVGGSGRWPRASVAIVTCVLCLFIVRNYPDGPVWLTGLVVLGVLSWRTNRRTAAVAAVVLLAALTVTAVASGRLSLVVSLIFVGWSAAAVFLGEALRSRRSYLAGLAERARFAERSREDELARRLAEERLRIARDLHDSVAHAMATINVQAGAATHVLARQPEAAGAALSAIQRASAEVLEELGSMLAVLRDDTVRVERSPAPGLSEVRRLADSLGPSGLSVELRMDGATESVSPVVSTAGYRVVQESLTNVLRHSQARRVRVSIEAGGDDGSAGRLRVEIRDRGPARSPDAHAVAATTGSIAGGASMGTGVGVRGMRERVVATGGRFSAGPTAEGGYLVRAGWGEVDVSGVV